MGPAGTRTMTFYSGGEASTGNKRTKKGAKNVVQESQPPEDTPLGNDARKRRVPALVMWYLPVIDHLRRIFLNPKEAALMTWWDDECKVVDDVIAHPPMVLGGNASMTSIKNSALTQGMYGLS